MERRRFLKQGGAAAGAIASASFFTACSDTDKQAASTFGAATGMKVYNWKAVTTWPPNFPVLGEAMVNIAKELDVMSAGRLKIKVYGAGELIPAFEAFDAVSQGAVQICHGAAYYWAGKIPASSFFASVPFGLTAQQMNAWLLYGGGLKLWRELYGQYGLVPFPAGNTGVQMGGWFNKEINSIEDLQGLKIRMPGLGGKVLNKVGASVINVAGGEIYTNLDRGNIDATEWIGPYHDYQMGFHKIAKYYYYPGWHEPGTVLEMFINQEAFEQLPWDLQEMVKTVTLKYNQSVLAEFEAKNNAFLEKLIQEEGVQLKKFPESVLKELKAKADEVIQETIAEDDFAKKVYLSFQKFKKDMLKWHETTNGAITPFL